MKPLLEFSHHYEVCLGDEAINAIVQEMENRRDSVIVILASYPEEIDTFLSCTPGLRSRIIF